MPKESIPQRHDIEPIVKELTAPLVQRIQQLEATVRKQQDTIDRLSREVSKGARAG